MKKSKCLAFFLALTLWLSPAALAVRGEKKVIVSGCFQITMDGFLRVETYLERSPGYIDGVLHGYDESTFYVVADNSTVTVEPAPGYHYGTDQWSMGDRDPKVATYAPSGYVWFDLNQQFSGWGAGHIECLTGPEVYTMTPSTSGSFSISGRGGIRWLCESDFARLPQNTYLDRGELQADSWAHYELERAFGLGLFPDPLDPFADDCTREMTRGEFADALLKLYERLGGTVNNLSRNTPFTDLPTDNSQRRSISLAYNLGLVEGTSSTTFSPDDPLTREQAAVMLGHIYEKMPTSSYEYFFKDRSPNDYLRYTDFDDADQISPLAMPTVAFMESWDIMRGVGNYYYETFAPKRALTLQEGMALVQRVLDDFAFERYWRDR